MIIVRRRIPEHLTGLFRGGFLLLALVSTALLVHWLIAWNSGTPDRYAYQHLGGISISAALVCLCLTGALPAGSRVSGPLTGAVWALLAMGLLIVTSGRGAGG